MCVIALPAHPCLPFALPNPAHLARVLHGSLEYAGSTPVFPLYLDPDSTQLALDGPARTPILAPAFVADFTGRLGLDFVQDGRGDLESTFGPEDVFDYIYAVLHCPTYRTRYAEFLKIDFPRVPLTSDVALFRTLVGIGRRLVALHLLDVAEAPSLSEPITQFPIGGSNVVEKGHPRYDDVHQRVWISADDAKAGRREQYWEGVPPEVWPFHVGGYQVCHKWLKDRQGRTLAYDDLVHYERIVVALAETIRLMGEVDAAVPVWPMGS